MMSGCFLKFLYMILLFLLHMECTECSNRTDHVEMLDLHGSNRTGQVLGFDLRTERRKVKCIKKDRLALLNFKQGLQDDNGMLSTWSDDENADCCTWKQVQCNTKTGHVEKLSLRGSDTQDLKGEINSQLIELHHLTYLDLSYNDFDYMTHIPKFMGSFINLRYLNLSFNNFVGQIPDQLGNLSQLRYLDLSWNKLYGIIPDQIENLSQLRYLDLSWNQLHGAIPNQIGNLSQLWHLNLNENNLAGVIPFQLGNLSMLQSLKLGYNADLKIYDGDHSHEAKWLSNLHSLTNLDLGQLSHLNYSHHWLQMIGKLPNLRELWLAECSLSDFDMHSLFDSNLNLSTSLTILDLTQNMLTSSILPRLVSSNPNLHELALHGNLLEGPIPANFGNVMNSLEYLDLSYNKLQGKIPTSIWNICTLQELDLDGNKLSGEVSSFFHNNSSMCKGQKLERLSLYGNQIYGEIPKDIGSLVPQLEVLSLAWNSLEGVVNESHFTNLSKLTILDLSYNSLELNLSTSWVPPFQLVELELASCKLGPSFPHWLQKQFKIDSLDISNNEISASVPEWFWIISQDCGYLNISSNNLVGTIPNLPLMLAEPRIILDSNQFEGAIPTFLLQASSLHLSNNKFTDIDSFLCGDSTDIESLVILDVSNNQLKGQLPDCWSHLKNPLEFLDLSNNKLFGSIPISMGTLVYLKALVLRNNSLTGELPSSLKNCTNLAWLDVGENNLSGPIPLWIGESLQQLVILSLPLNHFNGSLPLQLCYLLHIQVLDLSQNSLSYQIPTCLKNFTVMTQKSSSETISHDCMINNTTYCTHFPWYDFYLSLMWKGVENVFKNPELLLKSIDLSSNHLSGEIPEEFGYLSGLIFLNLSRNNLSGKIPSEIGNLKSLEFLDLSRNHLSGKIPPSLAQIDRLAALDLSNNRLYGKIPTGTQLQTQDASCYEQNLDLCGLPLDKKCPEDETPMPHMSHVFDEAESSVFFEAFYEFGPWICCWILGISRPNTTHPFLETCLHQVVEQSDG